LLGCAPYLQIFKGGKLIFTSAATLSVQQSVEELPFVQVVDGTIPFHVEQVVQGDILIRCRHLTFKKQRISMFRAAFHTGYAPANVLRLTKSQLDGACADKRFPDDFFLDLIFEKVDAETASKHLEEQAEEGTIDASSPGKGKGPVVKASNYDEMLQGDSRFWAVIANRRQEQSSEKDSDPNWGPTVGRRRGDDKKTGSDKYSEASVAAAAGANAGKLFETFSIGNEFDFLPDEPKAKAVQQPAEKDALMEALGALDDDGVDTEEIVFNDPTSGSDDSKRMESAASSVVDGGEANLPSGSENPGTETSGSKLTPAQSQVGSSAEGLEDLDSLLAAADDNLGEMNLEDFDDDDDEDLGDLEAMLNNT
jgi:C2 domain of PTEN tumour-suppressor protein